ncbi:hypothetical protein JCM3765_003023 [Sporobolomyces pararoseus]
MSNRKYDPSEPRRPDLAKPYRFRPSDNMFPDVMVILSMFSSALAMLTRFAIWPWLGILFAVSSLLGEKKLAQSKSREGSSMFSGWTCLMFGITSFLSIYTPLLTGQAQKAGGFPLGFNSGLIPIPTV